MKIKQNLKKYIIYFIGTYFRSKGQIWLESARTIYRIHKGLIGEKELDLLTHIISPGDVCLDVGANYGEWSYYMSKCTGSTGKVFAIEPVPQTTLILKRTLKKFSLLNVEMHQLVFGDSNRNMIMCVPREKYGFYNLPGAFVTIDEKDTGSNVKVQMVSLDSFVNEHNIEKMDFVKCDIEGAEMLFFKGAVGVLSKNKPVIICEITEKFAARFDYTTKTVFELLDRLGYDSFRYFDKTLISVNDVVPSENNYVFLHRYNTVKSNLLKKKGILCR